jgi:hypothetical protein
LKEKQIADKLLKEEVISESTYQKINSSFSGQLFSVGLEVKTLLYIGILLLSTGLGVLVYKNIDSIGHVAIISFIAIISIACIFYANTKRQPYTNGKVILTSTLADYMLLLGCLTFATFMGYLQYQFSAFGPHNEISFLIPAILFFTMAYYFDHIGVLSMAITALAGFVGVTITPLQVLSSNDLSGERIIFSGIFLGAVLVCSALVLDKKNIKKHFTFTYLNFAMHLLFISILAGMFMDNIWYLFVPILALFSFLVIRYAYSERSFYFLVFAIIYTYIGLSDLFFRVLFSMDRQGDSFILLIPAYFIATSVYIVMFLRRANKKIKPHDNI